ncbi:tetratricopeptide repeat protein 14 [Bombina bombina]|uniref:tetratricopeptide repeat protein 14 n=1 Tax=Bombina bombina TaxID=8345 RepID=UPI00235A52B0|nr:tetratricopeptide repeat protein 14 [Bombina bombina]
MDKDLVRQCLSYHGPTLLSLLKCEQHEHAGFKQLLGDLSKWPQYRKERKMDNIEIQQFVARKADLLFAASWNAQATPGSQESNEGYSAVVPPLEKFMEVPNVEKKELFFRDVERGDIVIGRIASIREFGFFMVLICMGGGILREISTLEISALCPVRDVPSKSSHGDPLSYYQIGDLIQAAVKDIDPLSYYQIGDLIQAAAMSLLQLTWHYFCLRQSVASPISNVDTYEKFLKQSLAFSNPSTIEFLLGKLGIDELNPPSLIRGLQRKNFRDQDYASCLRKKQSSSWALKCVKIGVDYFKTGRHVEAMNEYNKALEIDAKNVEALVARGALYATKGSLNKAIDDFEVSLENCPTHRNAKKYLCQTLVERGGQLEEEDKFLNAESYYTKALSIDNTFTEAEEALVKVRQHMQKSLEKREKQEEREVQAKEKKIETSAEKLRKLLKEEKRKKKRKRRSSSSSGSSDTSCSSSSSHGHKKHKKRKRRRKHSESSSYSSKTFSKASSLYEAESYSPPADTSASFLNRKSDMHKLLEERDIPGYRRRSSNDKNRYRSLSSSMETIELVKVMSEDSKDSLSSEKTQATSNRRYSETSTDKYTCHRKDSKLSYHQTDEGHKYPERHEAERAFNRKSDSKSSSSSSKTCAERRSSKNLCGLLQQDSTDRLQTSDARKMSKDETDNCNASAPKALPENLLNILSRIDEFQKEKGTKQKNK